MDKVQAEDCELIIYSDGMFKENNLGRHHDEAKGEQEAIGASKHKAVPALVLIVDHTAGVGAR